MDENNWVESDRNIMLPEKLAAIQAELDERGPIILEHWFYYAGRSPDRLIFDDYEEFLAYLRASVRPGDSLFVWSFPAVCRDDNYLTHGKFPNEHGLVPTKGAY